jgi:hypothetical protein
MTADTCEHEACAICETPWPNEGYVRTVSFRHPMSTAIYRHGVGWLETNDLYERETIAKLWDPGYATDVLLYARLRWIWHRLVGRW